MAGELDGQAEVVAGAMSTNPQRAKDSAEAWFLKRSYSSFQEMAEAGSHLPDGIVFVMITTPNHMHYPVARVFLEHGIHVVSDKQMSLTLAEDQDEVALVEKSSLILELTHRY